MSISSNNINVKLKFKNGCGDTEYYDLEVGSNILGRHKPSFLTDVKVSRRHAEIIVSEIGSITFNQLGDTNSSILLRPECDAIKLTKGIFQPLKHDDTICLYDGAKPMTLVIEKYEPMQIATLDHDSYETIATQELPDHSETNQSPLSYLKPDTKKRLRDSNNDNILDDEDDNNDNTVTVKNNNNNNTINNNSTITIHPTKKVKVIVDDSVKVNLEEGDMVFVKHLGSGACGQVSQYEWKGTPVAVKIIFKSLLHKDKKGEFEKESLILKSLRHPNIVLFMGTCTLQGNLAIVTEYLSKGSLRDVLNHPNAKQLLDWNTKIKMSIDIAQGMNYLHNYNPKIIHRDLKSVNLLVDNSFNVKVSDFGLSRFIGGGADSAKTFCGTLPFIAPEVFAGQGYSTKADVFSYGIVLWEILTHLQPIGNTASTKLGHPEIPPLCPIPFSELLKDCCNRNPDLRPNFSQIIQRLKSMISIDNNTQFNILSNQLNQLNNTTNINNNNNEISNYNNNNNNEQNDIKLVNYVIDIKDIINFSLIREEDSFQLLKGQYKDKDVLIKKLNSNITDFEKKQLDIIATLKSPLVQEFYGVVYNENEHAIIGEYCENDTLYEWMNNYKKNKDSPNGSMVITWNKALNIAIEMARAINVLHKNQPVIYHRGITSQSFLLTKEFNVKITDFGLSRFNIHESSASLAEIKGNFFYSPPELLGNKKFSAKSDIYSFAIVLWELVQLTLNQEYKKPFYHIDLEYDFQIIHHTSKFNKRPKIDESHIPKEFSKLLQQSWDPEPILRPDTDKIIEELISIKNKLELIQQHQNQKKNTPNLG